MNSRIESLGLIHRACWHELAAAGHTRDHGFSRMALATLTDGADGVWPTVRTMVLREAQPATRRLLFYSDARASKVAQTLRQPRAALSAWCDRLGWQMRLQATLSLSTDHEEIAHHWSRLQHSAQRADYLNEKPPGTPLDEPQPFEPRRGDRPHFSLLVAQVEGMDWLELHAEGHRRARFDAHGHGQWLAP